MSDNIALLIPLLGISVGLLAVGGWIFTTWLRVKHGYPLDNFGKGGPLLPQATTDTIERVRLLSAENAQLRAELGSVKDRLATVERIVTDGSLTLDREIERLRGPTN